MMKLWIWRRLPSLKDDQDGIAFAMAENMHAAREAVLSVFRSNGCSDEVCNAIALELRATPDIFDDTAGGYLAGSS